MLSDGKLSLSTWSIPDEEVKDFVRLRSGKGVGGTEPSIPDVASADVGVDWFEKQVKSRLFNKLATRCIYKGNDKRKGSEIV